MEIIIMETVNEILSKLENADNVTKNKLENELVSIGTSAVPQLVDELQVASVKYLKEAAKDNKDFEWVAEYLIREIECSVAA